MSAKKVVRIEEKLSGIKAYMGPTIPGVVRAYTVFTNGLPSLLVEAVERYPLIQALIVPIEHMSEYRKLLQIKGGPESVVYNKIQNYILRRK